jgi:hypothetical protein
MFREADRHEPILAPTFLNGPVLVRYVSKVEASRLKPILELLNTGRDAREILFDRFDLSGDLECLLALRTAIEQDVRLGHDRPFFTYRGRPMRTPSSEATLMQLAGIDERAHIATVGEVLVLLAARCMTLSAGRVLTPTLSLTGTLHPTGKPTWIALEGARARQKGRPNIRVRMLDDPHGVAADLVLLVRAHMTPFQVEARAVYRNPSEGNGT